MSDSIKDVLVRHAAALFEVDGIEGVGEGLCDGIPCIRLYVRDETIKTPTEIEGIPVSSIVTGRFDADSI